MKAAIRAGAVASVVLALWVSGAEAQTLWTWSDGSGLSASAQFTLTDSNTLQIVLTNTSTALPGDLEGRRAAALARAQLLTGLSLRLPRGLKILGGQAELGFGAETVGFDRVDSQLSEGDDVSAEWGFGNYGRHKGLRKHFISALGGRTRRFLRGVNLDGPQRLDGPQGGLAPDELLAPLGDLGAITGPVVFTLNLNRALDPDLFLLGLANSKIRFGRRTRFIKGATAVEMAVVGLSDPLDAIIIADGFGVLGVTVSNLAGVGALNLNYALSGAVTSGSASGGDIVPGFGSLAPGASEASTVNVTSNNVGVNTIRFTATAPGSFNGSASLATTLTVLAHSNGSFDSSFDQDSLTINLGSWQAGSGVQSQGFNIFNLVDVAGYTAGLDLVDVSGSGHTGTLTTTLANFTNLAAGSAQAFTAYFDTSTAGSFSASYVLSLSDQDLPGAVGGQMLTLTLEGSVTSAEPAQVGLAGPVNSTIITGGTGTLGATVLNVAPDGAANLNYSLSASVTSGSAALSGLSPTTGSLAPGASEGATVAATSTNIGDNTILFTATDPASSNGLVGLGTTLTVLAHSNGSFNQATDQDGLTINLGNWQVGSGVQSQVFNIFNLVAVAGFTAALDLVDVSGSGHTGTLTTTLALFADLAAGSGHQFTASLDTSEAGQFSAIYELSLSDQDLPGALGGQVLTLTLNGKVTDEPPPPPQIGLADPVNSTVISGGTGVLGATVGNVAGDDAANLNYTMSAAVTFGSASLLGPVSPASGSLVPGATHGVTIEATSTNIGDNAIQFTATDPAASNSPQAIEATLTVLAHSNGSFDASEDVDELTIDLGSHVRNSGPASQEFSVFNLVAVPGYTAALNLVDVSGSGQTGLLTTTLANFINLAAGSGNTFTASLDTSSVGSFSAIYSLSLSDQDLPGALGGQTLMLTLNGTVTAAGPAEIGLSNPLGATIIAGGTGVLGATVANLAAADAADLNYSLSASVSLGSAFLGEVAPPTGALVPGDSQAFTVEATSSDVGLNTILFTAADPDASNSPQTIETTLTVLAHSKASFDLELEQNSLTINLGTWFQGSGLQSQGFSVYNLVGVVGFTAALDLDLVDGNGDTPTLYTDLAPFADLAAGFEQAFTAYFDTSEVGEFEAIYLLYLSDQDLPGALSGQTLTLTLTGEVVPEFGMFGPEFLMFGSAFQTAAPEPHTLALLILGGLGFIGRAVRRRKR